MQIDTKAVAERFAEAEMQKLAAQARKVLSDATISLQPEDFDVAIERATELFDSAPWLTASESSCIGGCLHMTHRDIFALLVIANSTRLD